MDLRSRKKDQNTTNSDLNSVSAVGIVDEARAGSLQNAKQGVELLHIASKDKTDQMIQTKQTHASNERKAIENLVIFSLLMLVLPIASFFAAWKYVSATYAGITSACVANTILVAFVIVAFAEV